MSEVSTVAHAPSGRSSNWRRLSSLVVIGLMSGMLACDSTGGDGGGKSEDALTAESVTVPPEGADTSSASVALAERAAALFGELPDSAANPANPITEAKVDLGRMLYYDPRLSKNHDISCNSCHQLDAYGVDGEVTSPGHRGQRGVRNSPTVYHAALHVAQFWDGRAADVEAQAKGPILNPVEMAGASEEDVVAVLKSIPGYGPAFAAAFPDSSDPISYDNMARAIGAFERNLMTPAPFDRFLAGDVDALDAQQQRGLTTFFEVGCNTCHTGPAIGGQLYRKLGFIFPYETQDIGLEEVTGVETDRHQFKVPSLRNIAKTGPYFHDGSIADLNHVVHIMAYHQAGQTLDDDQIADVVAFLRSLTGEIDVEYIAVPELPASGPDTPAPNPQ